MRNCLLLLLMLSTSLRIASGQVPTSQGIGGYDLGSPNDQMFAFDWDSSGKQDHLVLYRPGSGFFWVLQNNGGTRFVNLVNSYERVDGECNYHLDRACWILFPRHRNEY